MKTATFYAVVAILASFAWNAFGQQPCPNGGGSGQSGVDLGGGFPHVVEAFPQQFEIPLPSTNSQPPTIDPTTNSPAPRARIRVAPAPTQSNSSKQNERPSARVSVAVVKPTPSTDKVKSDAEPESIQPELLGLVGKWSTVSRSGDGELSTVELMLDNRGWAKLTQPSKDGKRSTTKSRASLIDKELKLTGPDEDEISLGKLIEYDDRQMVLQFGGNQVTYVRI